MLGGSRSHGAASGSALLGGAILAPNPQFSDTPYDGYFVAAVLQRGFRFGAAGCGLAVEGHCGNGLRFVLRITRQPGERRLVAFIHHGRATDYRRRAAEVSEAPGDGTGAGQRGGNLYQRRHYIVMHKIGNNLAKRELS